MSLLDGKVALVTGAGQGIGREVALMLAQEGASVVVNDIGVSLDGATAEGPNGLQVVEEIKSAGGDAVANGDSVADWDGAHRMVETAVLQFGRLDIVVNNAGILRDGMFHKMTREQWSSVIDVHLNGTFNVSRAAADQFRKNESGAYVHLTSGAGLHGNIGQANYAAAKLGITALSKTIALEMGRFNVRSNCVAPAASTRMTQSIPANAPGFNDYSKRLAKMPARPVANLAVFLASDLAKDISGQVIGVRGNEIFLYSQTRLIRTLHRADGWTPQTLSDMLPQMEPFFEPLAGSRAVTPWDPI
jgi:NAD(P)-dependent dehydrogenase (short-subunit alcohol dehydrogenase family)